MSPTSLIKRWIPFGFLIVTILVATPTGSSSFAYAEDREEECTDYILQAEKEYNIPQGLLLALALVESGKEGKPYPWALNVRGRTIYSDSRKEAVQHIKKRKGKFPSNTMVGCMQLSVLLHNKAFYPAEQILEPEENVSYAGAYLKRHYKRYGNWIAAVKRYNGGTRAQKKSYVCRVWNTWENLDAESASQFKAPKCSSQKAAYIAPEIQSLFRTLKVAQAD